MGGKCVKILDGNEKSLDINLPSMLKIDGHPIESAKLMAESLNDFLATLDPDWLKIMINHAKTLIIFCIKLEKLRLSLL